MAELTPGGARGTERLHEYWVHGEGAAKIRWGEPDDFRRCVMHLGKFIRDPEGYCNLAHHAALGMWPAQHAAMEHKAGRADMTVAERADNRPYGDVTYADPKNGKYPVDTEEHARAAWAYINKAKNAGMYPMNGVTLSEVKDRIRAACKKFGIDISDSDDGGSASRGGGEYMRLYPLENIEILRSERDGDGREGVIVEAYAAVFGQPAEIADHEGHYIEEIDRAAFDTAIAFAQRNTGGLAGNVKVLYNHGLTVQGTPAPEFQLPIGVPEDIRPEERGLLTRTRYDAEDPFVQRLLGKIRQGSITAQSFTGRIIRSDPQLRRGDRHRPDSTGSLRTVRRMKLGLREYGPVLWPAYTGAEILGVRMSIPGGVLDPDEQFNAQAPLPDEGPAFAGNDPLPEVEHSARYHQHALYALRSKEAREKAGLVW